ncbi:hypothetical protein [Paenibacillus alvei]|nr:hypothetical protein [Paenibacillus alvei]
MGQTVSLAPQVGVSVMPRLWATLCKLSAVHAMIALAPVQH